ncbi:MAG: hypothetical protein WC050_01720 [Candidatus Paceibacterota bacterium]
MSDDNDIDEIIKERFKQLPTVVQQAIISADVEKELRALAQTHKLHIDQWGTLEDQVQMTLLGIIHSDDLASNLQKKIGMPQSEAEALAADISRVVFEPIRQELERQLEHPAAVAAKTTGVEDVRAQILSDSTKSAPAAVVPVTVATVAPGTPPSAPVSVQVERAPASSSYVPATPSHERKTIDGDPYREQLN